MMQQLFHVVTDLFSICNTLFDTSLHLPADSGLIINFPVVIVAKRTSEEMH